MECSVSECSETAKVKGFCRSHYKKNWYDNRQNRGCSIEDCNNAVYAAKLGLCEIHSVLAKVGKRTYGRHGYVFVFNPEHPNASQKSGMVAEHRMIMSDHIGRPLKEDETVHHVNGQRDDNRLSNLELWSGAQPAGQRVEDKIKWCMEYLNEHGYEVRKV